MRTKLIYIVIMLLGLIGHSQQDAQYTQYMYNTINVNPAYAGSRGVMSIFGLHRTQWVGLDGAPTTNAFSLNTPLKNSKLGLGLSIINDEIGPTTENTLSLDISYTVQTSETYNLSFGIKGTANLFNLDVSKLTIFDPTDLQFQNTRNVFTPNVGAGVYLHSGKSYLGLSVPHFLETKRYDDNSIAIFKERMTLYLIGGYVFNLTETVQFKPSFLTKMVTGAPLQVDISGNFLFNERFVLGAAWRWNAAVSGMVGFQINDGLFLGYGYDLETTKLKNYNSGSHEVFLRFELFKKDKKIVSPRFF